MEWIYNDVNELERHACRFVYYDHLGMIKVVLDEYEYQKRETTRHKYKATLKYMRLRKRDSNITLENVPKDNQMLVAATAQVIGKIKATWE